MLNINKYYINGAWVDPIASTELELVDPSNEIVYGKLALGSVADVCVAIAAAKSAFLTFSQSTVSSRVNLLDAIIEGYNDRWNEIADAMTQEMGAPMSLARDLQANMGAAHFETARDILKEYKFEEIKGHTLLRREPIGVCGFITPWNWPMNQIGCKAAPALATGCTFVWKPSELTPYSAQILTEVFHAAGVPAGVVNMVQGDGPTVGSELSSHRDIDMVSFTGSTRAGTLVASAAADSVKRVSQELGGKSANIILDDISGDQLQEAVATGVEILAMNSGQNCNAPSRMLVPASKIEEIVDIAKASVEGLSVGAPSDPDTVMGPVISSRQWHSIQGHIKAGIDDGSELITGGLGKPSFLESGYYIKPTIFRSDDNAASIAQNEVFGPVLVIIPYEGDDQAVSIANDSEYGLSGYVFGSDVKRINSVAARLRTGMVHVNGIAGDMNAPFGGYKKSGNGREWGEFGFEEFLETKAVIGFNGEPIG